MKFIIIALCLLLPSCSVKTEIIRTDRGYEVKSKRNALVVVKDKATGDQFVIDNRNFWYLEVLLSSTIAKSSNSIHVELDNLDEETGGD